ncbi:MAG: DUF2851 family protein [Bacteroidota bacterium]
MTQLFPPSEEFLQYLWSNRYFDHSTLQTKDGHKLQILQTGIWNRNQGPDFLQAHIRLDEIDHFGQIELHLYSKDWYLHGHDSDPQYNGTILHVVFQSDNQPIFREDRSKIPELVLEAYVDVTLWQKYDRLRLSEDQLPCHFHLNKVSPDIKKSYLEALGKERFQQKVAFFRNKLDALHHDWQQLLYRYTMGMLAGPVNKEAFEHLADELPYSLMRSYQQEPVKLEALFMGKAGMLDRPNDSYGIQLKEEWDFLQHKHQLDHVLLFPIKLLRMHPSSFPSLRLSQMGKLLSHFPSLVDLLSPSAWEDFLAIDIQAGAYWNDHYRLGEKAASSAIRRLGQAQKESILINVILPLSYLYLEFHGRRRVWEECIGMLTSLRPENNRKTRKWKQHGFPNQHALQSQGIIKLAKEKCAEKRCLECRIGRELIKP